MDIWGWMGEKQRELRAAGQQRLADLVDDLLDTISGELHDKVDALAHEAVILAKAADQPWVELFVRHWHAQSRILARNDVTQGMGEVVQLLDFAHGERTSNCPQSVCVTQDFCVAHSILDGPGYAEERRAVSGETLARIDAGWPCFGCISSEHADALFELERYSEAEAFCARQLVAMSARGNKYTQLTIKRAYALSRLGRHEEALRQLDALEVGREMLNVRRRHAIHRARELALVGRVDDAVNVMPGPDELQPTDFQLWLETERVLCSARPTRNTASLGRTLRGFVETLRANGALHRQGAIAATAAHLALERGDGEDAARNLSDLVAVLPKLRKPQTLANEHAALTARAAACKGAAR